MYGTYDKGIEALFQGYYDTVNDLVKRFNNLVVDNARIKNVNVDKLYATDTKIKTALIEDLVVGENVLMGENASIVWGQIEDPPHIPEHPGDIGALPDTWRPSYGDIVGAKPPIDANNTYSELLYNSNIRGFVNQGGVLYISADYIRAGTITGDRIYGGTIRGVTIDVDTSVRVGNVFRIGSGVPAPAEIRMQRISFNPQTVVGEFVIEQSWLMERELEIRCTGNYTGLANLRIGELIADSVRIFGNLTINNTIYGTISNAHRADYADSAGSVSWNNVTGKPSTFPPSAHNHHRTYCQILGNYDIWFEITSSGAINVYRNGSYYRTL